ncbi:MAG: lysoplasmalogenase [Gammaproteobacteria bacterium]|nr:lysoplasmalogenase [Gammaproteobacteria bacterium]
MTFFSSRNLVAIVGAGCSALVVLLLIGQDIAAAVSKLVASSAFVVLAIQVGGLRSNFGRLIWLGLVFSWFGDAFLIGETQTLFLSGLGAFLLAHVTYIAAFIAKGVSAKWTAAATLPTAAIAIAVSAWLAPHVPPELVTPVRVYTAAISLMVIAAFGTRGRGASILILAGALLFFLSDLSVAALRLVQTDFPTYIWGLPLYYAGQACLAVSTSQSRSH